MAPALFFRVNPNIAFAWAMAWVRSWRLLRVAERASNIAEQGNASVLVSVSVHAWGGILVVGLTVFEGHGCGFVLVYLQGELEVFIVVRWRCRENEGGFSCERDFVDTGEE